jgi:hypothetical protein
MMANVNVLGSRMVYEIVYKLDGTLIVTQKRNFGLDTPASSKVVGHSKRRPPRTRPPQWTKL